MSKNFEEEYKNMVQAEVPDLWGRIEAGLREKDVKAASETAAKQTFEEVTAPEKTSPEPVKSATGKKKNVIFKILPWAGGIAAAALILIIAIPTVILVNRAKNTKSATMEENAVQTVGMVPGAQYDMEDSVDMVSGMAEAAGDYMKEEATEAPDGGINYATQGKEDENSYKQNLNVEKGLESRVTGTPEAEENADERNFVYVRVNSVFEKDGKTCCMAETTSDVKDFSAGSDLAIESAEFVLSEDCNVEPETGGIYLATFIDDELLLIDMYE